MIRKRKLYGAFGVLAIAVVAMMAMMGMVTTVNAVWCNSLGYSTGNVVESVVDKIAAEPGDEIIFEVYSYRPNLNVTLSEMRNNSNRGSYSMDDQKVTFDGQNDTGILISDSYFVDNKFWPGNFSEPGDTDFYPVSIDTLFFQTNHTNASDQQFTLNWTEYYYMDGVGSGFDAQATGQISFSVTLTFNTNGQVTYTFPTTRANIAGNSDTGTVGMVRYWLDENIYNTTSEAWQNGTDDGSFYLVESSVDANSYVPILWDSQAAFFVHNLERYAGPGWGAQEYPYDFDDLLGWSYTYSLTSTGAQITTDVPINQADGTAYFTYTNFEGDVGYQQIDVGNVVQRNFPMVWSIFFLFGSMILFGATDYYRNKRKKDPAIWVITMIMAIVFIAMFCAIVFDYFWNSGEWFSTYGIYSMIQGVW